MNIMVCIKQVPDNASVPQLDPAGKVVMKGIELMESPFDLNALEAALQLTEANGGEVSVISVGDEDSLVALRKGLAMGAAHAYLVNDPALADGDSFSTSYALAKAIASIGQFDLILCGKQAIDDDNAQVGAGIAEQLNIAQLTNVNEIREVTADSITVKRVSGSEEAVVTAKLPAVLTCEKSLNEPRYPTLKRTRLANRAEIPTLDCAAIGADTAKVGVNSPSKVLKRYYPAPRQSGELIKGAAADIGKIAVQKLVENKIV